MHIPVMAEAALEWLSVNPAGTYVDCTAGAGGHSALIAEQLTTGRLIAIDQDPLALRLAGERLSAYPNVELVHGNFAELAHLLSGMRIASVQGVLIDAGVSSMQLDSAERGFSFQQEGPLDMRMNPTTGLPAAEFLQQCTQDDLAQILRDYGDLRHPGRIARAIVERSRDLRLLTTLDLVETVRAVYPFVRGIPDEVRTVFQAIRIAVNQELQSLRAGVEQAIDLLAPDGRLVVISFHSGEDRVIKNVFRDASRTREELFPDGRVKHKHAPVLKLVGSKPILPTKYEIQQNSRSQSAKMRVAEKRRPKHETHT